MAEIVSRFVSTARLKVEISRSSESPSRPFASPILTVSRIKSGNAFTHLGSPIAVERSSPLLKRSWTIPSRFLNQLLPSSSMHISIICSIWTPAMYSARMTSQNMQSSAVETPRRILSWSLPVSMRLMRATNPFGSALWMSRMSHPLPWHSALRYDSPKLSIMACFGWALPISRYMTLNFAIAIFPGQLRREAL